MYMKKWLGRIERSIELPGSIAFPRISKAQDHSNLVVECPYEEAHVGFLNEGLVRFRDVPDFNLDFPSEDLIEITAWYRGSTTTITVGQDSIILHESAFIKGGPVRDERVTFAFNLDLEGEWKARNRWMLCSKQPSIKLVVLKIAYRNNILQTHYDNEEVRTSLLARLNNALENIPKDILENIGIFTPVNKPIDEEALASACGVILPDEYGLLGFGDSELFVKAAYEISFDSKSLEKESVEAKWMSFDPMKNLPKRVSTHVRGLLGCVPFDMRPATDGRVLAISEFMFRDKHKHVLIDNGGACSDIAKRLLLYHDTVWGMRESLASILRHGNRIADFNETGLRFTP